MRGGNLVQNATRKITSTSVKRENDSTNCTQEDLSSAVLSCWSILEKSRLLCKAKFHSNVQNGPSPSLVIPLPFAYFFTIRFNSVLALKPRSHLFVAFSLQLPNYWNACYISSLSNTPSLDLRNSIEAYKLRSFSLFSLTSFCYFFTHHAVIYSPLFIMLFSKFPLSLREKIHNRKRARQKFMVSGILSFWVVDVKIKKILAVIFQNLQWPPASSKM